MDHAFSTSRLSPCCSLQTTWSKLEAVKHIEANTREKYVVVGDVWTIFAGEVIVGLDNPRAYYFRDYCKTGYNLFSNMTQNPSPQWMLHAMNYTDTTVAYFLVTEPRIGTEEYNRVVTKARTRIPIIRCLRRGKTPRILLPQMSQNVYGLHIDSYTNVSLMTMHKDTSVSSYGGTTTNNEVLVTGGAGFIGSALLRALLSEGYAVTVLDNLSTGLQGNLPTDSRLKLVTGDVRDYETVSRIVHTHQNVIHLAAQAFIPFCYQQPLEVAQVNAMGSLNVFKACLNHSVKRLVYISSSEVYGTAQNSPMNEKHPMHPYSTYSVAKAAADLWAQTFFWEHNLPVVILRPFNTFGPRETLPYFIPEMIRQCQKEPTIHVGTLKTSRDFTYVDDTTRAMVNALETENIEGDIINIGTGQTHEMKAILTLIQKETNTEDKPAKLDKARLRPRDVQTLVADNTKARKLLGWTPTTPFAEGIRKTITWYLDNGQTWGYEQHGWKWRY